MLLQIGSQITYLKRFSSLPSYQYLTLLLSFELIKRILLLASLPDRMIYRKHH